MSMKCVRARLALAVLAVGFAFQAVPLEGAEGFKIFGSDFEQNSPAVAYNFQTNEFLVVCGETRSGVTAVAGQFVKPDGTLSGSPFVICLNPGPYPNPCIAVNTDNQYLVAWQDSRNGNSDICGARLNSQGKKLVGPGTLADTTFVICDQDSAQYHPAIAFNFRDYCFIVIWTDYRNSFLGTSSYQVNSDVYGQRLNWDGKLLSPMDPPGTKVNYPVAASPIDDEYAQDVAYYGKDNSSPDEWLVVYTKYNLETHNGPVWGVRVNGKNGYLLDTFGAFVEPGIFGKATKTMGGQPWLIHFPIGKKPSGATSTYQGSPHVESNAVWPYSPAPIQPRKPYPIPEFFVVWTEMSNPPPDIKGQRVAYFPDSTAYRMKLKPARGTDSQFTAVLLDSLGKPPADYVEWITWPNHLICNKQSAQSYNNIAYNPVDGVFLAVWNDWRTAGWSGGYPAGGPYIAPQADIYGQYIFLDPADSSLKYLDANFNTLADRSTNIPYVFTTADEGNNNYPNAAWGRDGNQFLTAYEYDAAATDVAIDISGAFLKGTDTAVKAKPLVGKPAGYMLATNYPNPLNPGTTIEFTLPSAERTVVRVFDALGRSVAVLFDGRLEAGSHQVQWVGRDAAGLESPAGVYFVRIEAGQHSTTHKMALVR